MVIHGFLSTTIRLLCQQLIRTQHSILVIGRCSPPQESHDSHLKSVVSLVVLL